MKPLAFKEDTMMVDQTNWKSKRISAKAPKADGKRELPPRDLPFCDCGRFDCSDCNRIFWRRFIQYIIERARRRQRRGGAA